MAGLVVCHLTPPGALIHATGLPQPAQFGPGSTHAVAWAKAFRARPWVLPPTVPLHVARWGVFVSGSSCPLLRG
jgi:hypothetical protein